jgi:hypothetical protein
VTPTSIDEAMKMKLEMDGWSDPSLQWQQMIPTIEDRFMGLMEMEVKAGSKNGEIL